MVKIGQVDLEKKIVTHDDKRHPKAKGHMSDLGDLKSSVAYKALMAKASVTDSSWGANDIFKTQSLHIPIFHLF